MSRRRAEGHPGTPARREIRIIGRRYLLQPILRYSSNRVKRRMSTWIFFNWCRIYTHNSSILKILHCFKVSRSKIPIDLGHFRGIAIAS